MLKRRTYGLGGALAAAVLLLLAIMGAAAEERALLLDGVAARVNEKVITIADVMDVVRGIPPSMLGGIGAASDDVLRKAFRQALDELIDRELILQDFRDSGAQLQPWVVDQRVSEIVEQRFGGDRSLLMAALSEERITYNDWRERVREQLILASMRHAHADRHATVSPDAVRSYYNANPEQYALPATVQLQLIVIRPPAETDDSEDVRSRIGQVMEALGDGTPFDEVARRYSQGLHRERGGDWGWVEPEDLRREIAEALKALNVGEHSAPIETPDEWYVVRKVAERDAHIRPLSEVWDRISARLQEKQASVLFENWIGRLRQEAEIVVHELP